jgi:hypothetical protein
MSMADQSAHVVRHAVFPDGSSVRFGDAHDRLPEGALPAVFLEPEVYGVCDLRIDLPRMLPAPHTQTDARGGEVMDLPRQLLAVRAADVDPLIVHEVAEALAHRYGHGFAGIG